MPPDFNALLKKPLDDVKRPPVVPAGTYYGIISAYKFQETPWVNNDTGEKDAQVRFSIKNVEPGEDILASPELLEGVDLSKRQFNADLPLSGGNEWVTKLFLDGIGVQTSGGRGFGETVPEAVGASVMFDVTHRMSKTDPSAPPFADVRNLRARPK